MSMNCLTCQTLQRTASENENNGYEKSDKRKMCCMEVARSWSGNLNQPPYEQMKGDQIGLPRKSLVEKKVKVNRRLHSGGCGGGGNEPRLVRSSGMRRDWSFEDLRLRDEKKGRFF